jgi:hypothetical protein
MSFERLVVRRPGPPVRKTNERIVKTQRLRHPNRAVKFFRGDEVINRRLRREVSLRFLANDE